MNAPEIQAINVRGFSWPYRVTQAPRHKRRKQSGYLLAGVVLFLGVAITVGITILVLLSAAILDGTIG